MGAVRRVIDLNADLGESAGDGGHQPGGLDPGDAAVLRHVSTAHVACGFHAGTPSGMAATIAAAVSAGVAVGAHPSYADRQGFGRRELDMAVARIVDDLTYQLGAFEALARAEGATLASVKPHGALYHRLCVDADLAAAVAHAVATGWPGVPLVLPAGSAAQGAAEAAGAAVLAEAFCDRAYRPDGRLADRAEPGAVLGDPQAAAGQALSLATSGRVTTTAGTDLVLCPATLCLHGDTPGAPGVAAAVRRALDAAGVRVAAPGRPEPTD